VLDCLENGGEGGGEGVVSWEDVSGEAEGYGELYLEVD